MAFAFVKNIEQEICLFCKALRTGTRQKAYEKREYAMSKITVVAQVVAKSDAVDAVKAELLKMIAPTRQEQGCIEYTRGHHLTNRRKQWTPLNAL